LSQPALAYAAVESILARLGEDLANRIVLVGGQAVNFWAEYFAGEVAGLVNPDLASKDLDFCGDGAAVRLCAERLGGKAKVATMDDITPNTGIVLFSDEQGVERLIDFIGEPHGLDADEVRRLAVPFDVERPGASSVQFWVMNPVHSMESRVYDLGIGKRDRHALAQLKASVLCAREYLRSLLVDLDRPRDVLTLNERIFRFATKGAGKDVAVRFGVEPFNAVLVDHRLPEMFRVKRYPQMQAAVTALRQVQTRQHLELGERREARWEAVWSEELGRVRTRAGSLEQRALRQAEQQRARLLEHEQTRPREPGKLGALVGGGARHAERLAAWGQVHGGLERRLEGGVPSF
jgi:hypothetical protein